MELSEIKQTIRQFYKDLEGELYTPFLTRIEEEFYPLPPFVVTEDSILPNNYIQRCLHDRNNGELWKNQYLSFSQFQRDEAAKLLYENLSEEQRKELKEGGYVHFICQKGHKIKVAPTYANTTSVGCMSLQGEKSLGFAGYRRHARTTIGGFLLTLKLRFLVECTCDTYKRGYENEAGIGKIG